MIFVVKKKKKHQKSKIVPSEIYSCMSEPLTLFFPEVYIGVVSAILASTGVGERLNYGELAKIMSGNPSLGHGTGREEALYPSWCPAICRRMVKSGGGVVITCRDLTTCFMISDTLIIIYIRTVLLFMLTRSAS